MAESKKFYWLKLKTNFFTSKEIKKLRRIAGGDTFTIIYLKMLLLSVKTEGKLYYENVEDSFAEELALELDEDVENVSVVLNYLERYKLIERGNDTEFLLHEAVASLGSETQSAERVRKFREKHKALQCNAAVTPMKQLGNTEIEIELELEKELEIDKDKCKTASSSACPYQEIIDLYNSTCISLPKVRDASTKRKQAIKARPAKYKELTGKEWGCSNGDKENS